MDALKYLESIIHPFVQSVVKAERKNLQDQGHAFAIYDVPLLYEKQMEDQFDHVVVVYCAPEQQIERLMERNALTREEAQLRLGCQKSIEEKKGLATTVINNTGSYQELSSQVDRWINEFTKSLK